MFAAAWAASMKIYDAKNPLAKVADVIGGAIATNIRTVDEKYRWKNTCAVRMSYILNQTGSRIPKLRDTVSGADGMNYFYRVKDLRAYLERTWGAARQVDFPPSGGGPLAGKQGVILFAVSGWSDAGGHATLFNGITCYDNCYFNEPEANYRTDSAYFWSLS